MVRKEVIDNLYVVKSYPPWNKARWVILLLLIPALIFIYGTMLLLLYSWLCPFEKDALLHAKPDAGAWYFAAIILTIGTCGLWMQKIYQRYQKARFKSFPFNTTKPALSPISLLKALAWIFCSLAFVFIVLIYDNYFIIYKDKVVINEFTSLEEKTHLLHQVKSITFIEGVKVRKKLKYNPRYILRFYDGSVYQTKDNMLDDIHAVEFLAAKNNIIIDSLLRE